MIDLSSLENASIRIVIETNTDSILVTLLLHVLQHIKRATLPVLCLLDLARPPHEVEQQVDVQPAIVLHLLVNVLYH